MLRAGSRVEAAKAGARRHHAQRQRPGPAENRRHARRLSPSSPAKMRARRAPRPGAVGGRGALMRVARPAEAKGLRLQGPVPGSPGGRGSRRSGPASEVVGTCSFTAVKFTPREGTRPGPAARVPPLEDHRREPAGHRSRRACPTFSRRFPAGRQRVVARRHTARTRPGARSPLVGGEKAATGAPSMRPSAGEGQGSVFNLQIFRGRLVAALVRWAWEGV